jgi:hypothetical protein
MKTFLLYLLQIICWIVQLAIRSPSSVVATIKIAHYRLYGSWRRNNSGNLAIFAAIRRASSLLSSFAANLRPARPRNRHRRGFARCGRGRRCLVRDRKSSRSPSESHNVSEIMSPPTQVGVGGWGTLRSGARSRGPRAAPIL